MQKMRERLRSTIRMALSAVAAPMDVIADSVVVDYALDWSVVGLYCRTESDRLAAEIEKRQQEKLPIDAYATMTRYRSFIDDDWLRSIETPSLLPEMLQPNMYDSVLYSFRTGPIFRSIIYDGTYDQFQISINGLSVVQIGGCPSSARFRIFIGIVRLWLSIDDFIRAHFRGMNDGIDDDGLKLFDFSKTGRIDSAVARRLADRGLGQLVVVVHAYFRLTQVVDRGGCISTDSADLREGDDGETFYRCDGCRRGRMLTLPFPDGLYDDPA